jgi:hypothetical protein
MSMALLVNGVKGKGYTPPERAIPRSWKGCMRNLRKVPIIRLPVKQINQGE